MNPWYSLPFYRTVQRALATAVARALVNPEEHEPQLVANLVCEIPREIGALNLSFIKCGGVFVHQTPLVKCKDFPDKTPKSVEIGDLLLLRKEVRPGRPDSRSALLLQAKKLTSVPQIPDNKNQHHLYAKWPAFEYGHATAKLNGQRRHIRGLDIFSACQYLLLFRNSCLCTSYLQDPLSSLCSVGHCAQGALIAHPTEPALSHYRCFVGEIVYFVFGEAGKRYKVPPHHRDKNWNKVIEDLTTITAESVSVYMDKASGSKSTTRGSCLCFLSGEISGILGGRFSEDVRTSKVLVKDGEVPRVPERNTDLENDQGAGIPVIEFTVELDD